MNNCGHCGSKLAKRGQDKYCSQRCFRTARQGSADPIEAFWAKVDKTAPGGCWLYMGFRKWDGYGWLQRGNGATKRSLTAHRYAWILTNGEPPAGAHILHTCDVPACCNPDHLRVGTHQDNMDDKKAKGRTHGLIHHDRVRPARKVAA